MNRLTRAVGVAASAALLAGCGTTIAPRNGGSQSVPPRISSYGTVTGRFLREGGPLRPGDLQPVNRPLAGTIWFTAAGRRPVDVQVGNLGRFTVRLPAGTYHVYGIAPSLLTLASHSSQGGRSGGSGGSPGSVGPGGVVTWRGNCSLPAKVRVIAGKTTHVVVACTVP